MCEEFLHKRKKKKMKKQGLWVVFLKNTYQFHMRLHFSLFLSMKYAFP